MRPLSKKTNSSPSAAKRSRGVSRVEIELHGRLPGISRVEALALVREALALSGRRAAFRLGIVAVDDKEIRRLNRAYRGEDKVTDVLSFRLVDGGYVFPSGEGAEDLGDIFICAPQVRRQAQAVGRAVRTETALMVVHGTLHLLGYDHRAVREESVMFALQQEALMRMKYF